MKHRTRLTVAAAAACLLGGCASTDMTRKTQVNPDARPALAAGDSLGRSMFEQDVQLAAARFRAQDLAQVNRTYNTD